jgi:iron complex outermembrane receptor protein
MIWFGGAGYRYTHDDFHINYINNFVTPASRNDQLFSAFAQDEITLIDDSLWFTRI